MAHFGMKKSYWRTIKERNVNRTFGELQRKIINKKRIGFEYHSESENRGFESRYILRKAMLCCLNETQKETEWIKKGEKEKKSEKGREKERD